MKACRYLVLATVFASIPLDIVKADERPVVIAHRGASGYLPEHTLAAKAMAFAMGADFLEQDLVLSKDAVPVVLHDIHLDTVTNVAHLFSNRCREDGRYYALDFTVAELKQLSVTERIHLKSGSAIFPSRFPAGNSSLQISTFEEEIKFISGLNHSTGKNVGIYPEIKNPSWHREQGYDLSSAVLEVLKQNGYHSKEDNCWLQCFEFSEVKRLREDLGWNGWLVQLLGNRGRNVDGTDYTFLKTQEGLERLAQFVDAIGPDITSIISGADPSNYSLSGLVSDAHALGLKVHPYTARLDALPKTVSSIEHLHHILFREAKIDGLFTDFPDLTASFLKQPPSQSSLKAD